MASKNNKKKPSDGIYQKRVKPKKETILIPVSIFDAETDTREVIETVRKFGKEYVRVKNT